MPTTEQHLEESLLVLDQKLTEAADLLQSLDRSALPFEDRQAVVKFLFSLGRSVD